MTNHGPIYQMMEQEIEKLYAGYFNEEIAGIFLSKILPKIQELEPTWIPVEERLPSTRINVLVVDGNNRVREAEYTGHDWFVSDEDGYRRMKHDYQTHWQPLPQPPTK